MMKSNLKLLLMLCLTIGFMTVAKAQIYDSKIHAYRASLDPNDGEYITLAIFNGNVVYGSSVEIEPNEPFNPFDNPIWFQIDDVDNEYAKRYESTDSQGNVTYRLWDYTATFSPDLLTVTYNSGTVMHELDPEALKKGELKWAKTSTRDNIPPKLTFEESDDSDF